MFLVPRIMNSEFCVNIRCVQNTFISRSILSVFYRDLCLGSQNQTSVQYGIDISNFSFDLIYFSVYKCRFFLLTFNFVKSIADLNKDKKIENIPSTIQGFRFSSSSSQSMRTNLAHFRQPKQLKNNSFQHADRRSTPRRFRVHCWRSRSQVAIPLQRSYVLVLIINKTAAFFALKSAGCTDTSINHTSKMRAPVLPTPPGRNKSRPFKNKMSRESVRRGDISRRLATLLSPATRPFAVWITAPMLFVIH